MSLNFDIFIFEMFLSKEMSVGAQNAWYDNGKLLLFGHTCLTIAMQLPGLDAYQ
jgi:hypothetical protein